MMLKNDLYKIQALTGQNNTIDSVVELNAAHDIFKGHFPEHPVLPGACMLQMTREISEDYFKQKLLLVKADDIRFSAMVDPGKNKEVRFVLQYKINEDKTINVSAKIMIDDAVCCKIRSLFKAK